MIKCLLWDFGDTLRDELSLWKSSPEWMDTYHSFGDEAGLGMAWNLGELDANQFAVRIILREATKHVLTDTVYRRQKHPFPSCRA
jgi:hypothetical protein